MCSRSFCGQSSPAARSKKSCCTSILTFRLSSAKARENAGVMQPLGATMASSSARGMENRSPPERSSVSWNRSRNWSRISSMRVRNRSFLSSKYW